MGTELFIVARTCENKNHVTYSSLLHFSEFLYLFPNTPHRSPRISRTTQLAACHVGIC